MVGYQHRQFLDFSKEMHHLNILQFFSHFGIDRFIFSNSKRILDEGTNLILYSVLYE